MENIEQTLAQFSFFQGFSSRHLKLIGQGATLARFDPNEMILKEGEDADKIFFIKSGVVAIGTFVPGKGNITIQTLGAGELLGWSWLVRPFRWRFAAKAVEESEVVVLNAGHVRRICEGNPELGYEVMKRVVDVIVLRLQATRLQLLDLYALPEGKK